MRGIPEISELIVTCNFCKGFGFKEREDTTSFHNGEYDRWYEDCKRCEGNGRLKKITSIHYTILHSKPKIGRENLRSDQ